MGLKSFTLLKATGQSWKFNTAIATVIVGGVVYWASKRLDNEYVFWTSCVIMFGGLIFGCTSIRCPACRARLMWKAVSERDHREWGGWLLSLDRCPMCGFPVLEVDSKQPMIECPRCHQMTVTQSFCEVCGKDLRQDLPPVTLPTVSMNGQHDA